MSEITDATRDHLARQRLELLKRETAHLVDARRILTDIETSDVADPKLVRAARRSVELVAKAQTLGVIDAHRVGVTRAEIGDATGMPLEDVDRALRRD